MFHRPKLRLPTCALICHVFAASLSFAQTSDEEGLRLRLQRKPKKSVAQHIIFVPTGAVKFLPYLTGKGIKHTAVYIDQIALIPRTRALLTSDDGLVALYPTASLGGRSGLGGELKFFNKRFLRMGDRLYLQAAYSTMGHQDHFVRYKIPEMFGRLSLDMRAGYRVVTNEDFFGIGNETDRDDRTNFRHEKLGGELKVGGIWKKWLRTRLLVDYADHVLGDGEGDSESTLAKFNEDTAPSIGGATLLGVGGSIALDTRDNDFYPSKGSLAQLSATLYNQIDDDRYGFTRYHFEVGHCLTLYRPGRVLAVRLVGEMNTRLSDDKQTPFFERASLGGDTTLRGYSSGRFRDKDLILLNVEYRYPIWEAHRDRRGAMDAVIFTDVGRVFNDLAEDTISDYKKTFGGGIRARTMEDFVFRAEVAWSKEETNLIFKFEPMF